MLDETTPFPCWHTGADILYQFWRPDGSLSAVHPAKVVDSHPDHMLCWVLPGTPIRTSTAPNGCKPHDIPLSERFSGPRIPSWSTWREYPTLRLVFAHQWSSVWWFFEPDGTFRNWYVNLELPIGSDSSGVHRVDGVLDVEVLPDLRWEWKDEDEVEAALAAGRLDQPEIDLLRAEGKRLIALAEAGRYPFDGTHLGSRPDPDWTIPSLPAALRAP